MKYDWSLHFRVDRFRCIHFRHQLSAFTFAFASETLRWDPVSLPVNRESLGAYEQLDASPCKFATVSSYRMLENVFPTFSRHLPWELKFLCSSPSPMLERNASSFFAINSSVEIFTFMFVSTVESEHQRRRQIGRQHLWVRIGLEAFPELEIPMTAALVYDLFKWSPSLLAKESSERIDFGPVRDAVWSTF